MKHIIELILFLIIPTMIGCDMKDRLFIGEYITFPELKYYNPVSGLIEECNDTTEYDYTYISFFGKERCGNCEMKELYKWDSIVEEAKTHDIKLGVRLIYQTRDYELPFFRESYLYHGNRAPVYLDTEETFLSANNFIPSDKPIFHTFLTDSTNKVIIIGDPIHNPAIHKMLEEHIFNNITTTNK